MTKIDEKNRGFAGIYVFKGGKSSGVRAGADPRERARASGGRRNGANIGTDISSTDPDACIPRARHSTTAMYMGMVA